MSKPCKKGKGCLEDICGKKFPSDDAAGQKSSQSDSNGGQKSSQSDSNGGQKSSQSDSNGGQKNGAPTTQSSRKSTTNGDPTKAPDSGSSKSSCSNICSSTREAYSTSTQPPTSSGAPTSSGGPTAAPDSSTSTSRAPTSGISDATSEGFRIKNPNISRDKEDILYHLALGNKSHDLVEMFGDIKFVCLGGTPHRMERFAYFILQEIGFKLPPGTMLQDISIHSHRYAFFKVGPVIAVSHGMGMPSISILLHELIKLMYHARVDDPIFFRMGTCGGLGLEPGTVVVSTEALNGLLEPVHVMPILGKRVDRPAVLNQALAQEVISMKEPSDNFSIVSGKTMCTDDFYEGQGRLDGAFCHFTEEEKFQFLKMAKEKGVTNIEMESLAMAAITNHVGIKSAVICVTLLDRLTGDQINQSKKTLEEWQDRPMVIVGRYIKKYLKEHGDVMAKVENKPRQQKSIACPDCVSVQKSKFNASKDSKDSDESMKSTTSSTGSDSLSESSQSSNSSSNSETYGCLPGCSIVVSSADYLKRVLDESHAVD